MMGERRVDQAALFYTFSLEDHVPANHLLRSIDRFVELEGLRAHMAPFYSAMGRPSIDPELLIRMLLVGYCFGIRSERRLCEEVHLNLAYRWFCRLGLDGDVPDHSTFSKNRHGRFRDSDLLRELFETVLRRCMAEGLVGGEGFAVDVPTQGAPQVGEQRRVDLGAGCEVEREVRPGPQPPQGGASQDDGRERAVDLPGHVPGGGAHGEEAGVHAVLLGDPLDVLGQLGGAALHPQQRAGLAD